MDRWTIITRTDSPEARFAAETVSGALQRYAGYIPVINANSGNSITLAVDRTLPDRVYNMKVCPQDENGQQVYLTGADESAMMYAAMDFVYQYLARAEASDTSCHPYFFRKLFGDEPLPAIDVTSEPAVAHRGLWMWGHCIYDYRAMLEAMARVKLNEIIIWNDYLPVNHREVVSAAHEKGIKVIWGYPWGWDNRINPVDLSDPEALRHVADEVVEKYEREYDGNGDGIYFQSFTETSEEVHNGRLIAEVVVEFVNGIAARLLEKHPGLLLQFGLHATSVNRNLAFIAQTDPRVHIVWEDCGDFPYDYIPCHQSRPDYTRDFTDKMRLLRPGTVNGAVLKGMMCLDWGVFEHQRGPYVLGCADERTIAARKQISDPIWRYIQADWMTRGDAARQTILQLSQEETELYALAEDGVIERGMPLPVALYAAMLWAPEQDFAEMLRTAARRSDVVLY